MSSSTPSTIQLQFRKADFDFSSQDLPWLGSLIQSHFFHALSIFIPTSERYVSSIIQKQLPNIKDDSLLKEAKVFIQQEGRHAFLHKRCNQILIHRYPALSRFQKWQTSGINTLDRLSSSAFRLSVPVAFEHFTANISRHFLQHQQQWTNEKSNAYIDFLHWHCLEELEHQAICFDVYKQEYKRTIWIPLSLIMFWLPITILSVYGVQAYLLYKDKQLNRPKHWWAFAKFVKKTSHLFYDDIVKYLKKDYRPWTPEDESLYKRNRP